MNQSLVTTYENLGRDTNNFYESIYWHPKCSDIQNADWNMIFWALRFAEEVHRSETRKVNWEQYISHPIEIVLDYIKNSSRPHPKSIIVLLLHDVLESAPQRWRDLLALVPIDIFVRVLKLSKPDKKTSQEIYQFFSPKTNTKDFYVQMILDILTDTSAQENVLKMKEWDIDIETWRVMLTRYTEHLDRYFPDMTQSKKQMEIDSLWHYMFFDRIDAEHKFYDTCHNLSDVHLMQPDTKEKYILRRIPKLNALDFVMRKYNMSDHLNLLKTKWQAVGWRSDHLGNFVMHDQVDQLQQSVTSSVTSLVS